MSVVVNRDEAWALGVIVFVAAALAVLVCVLAVTAPSREPLPAPRVVITPTATSTTSTPATVAALQRFDASGYPVRTDRAHAQRAGFTCPPTQATP